MSRYDYYINQGMFTGTAFEVLNLTTAASTGFNPSVYGTKAMRAQCTVEGGQLRYRYDGTAPTISTGHLVGSGDTISIIGPASFPLFMAIAVSGTSTVMVTYEADKR